MYIKDWDSLSQKKWQFVSRWEVLPAGGVRCRGIYHVPSPNVECSAELNNNVKIFSLW